MNEAFHMAPQFFSLEALFAVIALGLGIAALVSLRSGSGRGLAALAVGAAVLTLLVGGLAHVSLRHYTDVAVATPGLSPVDAERIRRAGYEQARSPVVFGFGVALLPLLLAGAASAASQRKQGGSVALVASTLGAAGLLLVVDAALMLQPLPGHDLPVQDPAWLFVGAQAFLSPCLGVGVATPKADCRAAPGCALLRRALATSADGSTQPADPAKVPDVDVPALTAYCEAHPTSAP